MIDFRFDEDDLNQRLRQARNLAETAYADEVTELALTGAGLDADDLAVLWFAPRLDTDEICELARTVRARRPSPLETFSPLYLTNTCDAECRMCGMRRDNPALIRKTATTDEIDAQLRVLKRRGMRAVALLTGEYRGGSRSWAMLLINQALKAALNMGFGHVLINAGSVSAEEFDALLAEVPRNADGSLRPRLTMCTFQETYSRRHYAKLMGTAGDNPRADFDRRLTNFDRSFRAGFRVANPGVLVGLNPDLAFEMTAMAMHADHLLRTGMEVYLSVPRLRQIAGGRSQGGASDRDFIRLVSALSIGLPACKIVITTREDSATQRRLVPIAGVISAGSAAVAPYTESGARFPLETSQFEVIDKRPFEDVLREHLPPGATITYFEPPAAAPTQALTPPAST